MSRDEIVDPLSRTLAGLEAVMPRESHDLRVRARCYTELARRRAQTVKPPRPFRLTDLVAAGAIALYLAGVLTDALQLLIVTGR